MPDLPPELAYIWQWYCELCSANPLTFSEMAAWAALAGVELLSWEAELLRSLDRIFWKVMHE